MAWIAAHVPRRIWTNEGGHDAIEITSRRGCLPAHAAGTYCVRARVMYRSLADGIAMLERLFRYADVAVAASGVRVRAAGEYDSPRQGRARIRRRAIRAVRPMT